MAENVEVKLKNVRLSFLTVFRPKERRDDKTKELTGYNYATAILLDKKDDAAQIEAVKAAMRKARESEWGENPPRIQADKYCMRDGEPLDPDTNEARPLYDGYEGKMYISANRPVGVEDYEAIKKGEKDRPVTVIGPKKGANGKFAILSENSEFAPYSGCYANVIIRIYAFPGKENQPPRINASLEAIQFVRHGERFGGSAPVDADSAFDEVEGYDDMDAGSSSGTSGGSAAASDDDFLA